MRTARPEVATVTANPAADHTVWIPGFRPGEVNRVAHDEVTPGGKGVNVAAFLAATGVPVVATGFLGTDNAALFERFFEQAGIAHCFVPVAGATRTGIKIVDVEAATTTDINFPGFRAAPEHLAALEERVAEVAVAGGWVVLAGSLPPGAPPDTYRRLVELVHERGAQAAVDTSGPALEQALEARPDLVKPNRAELEELTGRVLGDRASLRAAAAALAEGGPSTVVVSLGAAGALFFRDGAAVFATPPPVDVASTVGAGDAMVAGTVAAILRALPLGDLAALATAFSALAISQVGPHLDAGALEEKAGAVAVEVLR